MFEPALFEPASIEFVAHGVGGSTDLPIPFSYAVVGASWALTISFAVLALAWKEPRYADGADEPPRARRPVWGVVGLVLSGWVLSSLFFGPAEADNAGLQAIYIFVWVGLVFLALVAGHLWRDLSPWRTIQAVVGRASGRPDGWISYPKWLGCWPAALGLFAFVWMELASPDPSSVDAMRTWMAVYVVITLIGGVTFGPTWFDRADPFDVFSGLVARLSPFVAHGRWSLHNPLRSLPNLPIHPGLVVVIATLLGSTAFDSFSASAFWQRRDPSVLVDSLTLLGFCSVVAIAFTAAAMATGGVERAERRALPGLLTHSLVPIVVGYVIAHYLTLIVEKGQTAFYALLDPWGQGWQPLGEPTVQYVLSNNPTVLAVIKVGAVLVGHVVAVIAAHDKALVVLPKAHRLTGQLAMLGLMVCYTFGGLYLLFAV